MEEGGGNTRASLGWKECNNEECLSIHAHSVEETHDEKHKHVNIVKHANRAHSGDDYRSDKSDDGIYY